MTIGFDAKRAFSNKTGLGNYSRLVIEQAARSFPDKHIVLFAPRANFIQQFSHLLNFQNLYCVIPTRGISRMLKSVWRSTLIVKDIRRHNIDIYHGLSNELPWGLNQKKVKSIVTIHDLIFRTMPESYHPLDRIIYEIKSRHACKKATLIIAVSECTKRDIVRFYNIAPEKIEVVYQGCQEIFKKTVDASRIEKMRQEYSLPQKYILNVGTIERRKNLLLILKALKLLPESIKLVAIGKPTSYLSILQEFIRNNKLESRVIIINDFPQKYLPALYAGAEIFIYPSLYEGFGIPVIEAMNIGIPVIAAKGSCLEEAGGPDSLYFNAKNEQELAAMIMRVAGDAALRERMITRGKQYVQRFSDSAQQQSLKRIYERVISLK